MDLGKFGLNFHFGRFWIPYFEYLIFICFLFQLFGVGLHLLVLNFHSTRYPKFYFPYCLAVAISCSHHYIHNNHLFFSLPLFSSLLLCIHFLCQTYLLFKLNYFVKTIFAVRFLNDITYIYIFLQLRESKITRRRDDPSSDP